MKLTYYIFASLLVFHPVVYGDALNKKHVAPDAKWLLHLDCENLRGTKVGEFLMDKFVTKAVADATSEMDFDASNVLQRVTSITAYGTDFKKGPEVNAVLLVHADAEIQKAVVGMLEAQLLANADGPVEKDEADGAKVYTFGKEVLISPEKGGTFILSKSRSQIDKARELLAEKRTSLATSKAFSEFPAIANSFFFLGVAEAPTEPDTFPAQAKVLQMADGGRVALGEKADQLFLNLALRGKTAEVTKQIQQVLEGMVALVTLGQPDNAELMELAKSTKVSATDQMVMVNLEYPTAKALSRLDEEMNPKPQPKKAKTKRAKKRLPPKAEQEEVKPEAEKAAP
jgi:hypothetical protein